MDARIGTRPAAKKQRMSFWVLNANYEVTTSTFTKVTEEKIKVSRQRGNSGFMKWAVNTTATCRDRPITVIGSGSEELWGHICDLKRYKEQRRMLAKNTPLKYAVGLM